MFEAKWSQKPDQKAIVPMQRLQDKIKSVSQKYVLCRTDSSYPLNDANVVNGFTDQSWLELL
ncbi:MAG: hypothetical protein NTX25_10890 [Proteobacteria bacterium]|nr:hypothetical protein [Pseudomonadota bacterium]